MFGIGEGPSGQEGQQYNNLTGLSNTETNMGLGDLQQSQGFMQAILSGDPAKIGQVLGPQIQAIQGQGQQQKQTMGQFGNRGGGTNASAQTIGDNTRTQTNNLISSLTGSALSGLNSTGLALTSQGQQGFGQAFGEAQTMQAQHAAQMDDLFKSIASFAAAPFTGGASLGGLTGGGGTGFSLPTFGGSSGGGSGSAAGGWGDF